MPVILKKPAVNPVLQSDWAEPYIHSMLADLRGHWKCQALPVEVRTPSLKWRLASAMQKAFRRGQEERLKLYLSGLAQIDPGYAWRRFALVVMEDAGTALSDEGTTHLDMYATLLYLAGGKERRQAAAADVHDLIKFASYFCGINRDRSVCDTIGYMHSTVDWNMIKAKLAGGGPTRFIEHLDESPEDAWALAALCDTSVTPIATLATMLSEKLHNAPEVHRWIAMEGTRQRLTGMFAVFPWVVKNMAGVKGTINEEFPPSEMIGAYPTEAFDQHSSEGKRAMHYFLSMNDVPFTKYVRAMVADDRGKAFDLMREPMFVVELGKLTRRRTAPLSWDVQMQWKTLQVVTEKRLGAMVSDATLHQMLQLLKEAIPALNYARKKVVIP